MPTAPPPKLTSLSACAGCASKLSQTLLAQVLRHLPAVRHPRLLVDASTADDAGVYRLRPDCALVQTIDFFTPIVDDPYLFGQIAAANALSDVYAMGGRPLTAMNVLVVPTDALPPAVIAAILRGGAAKVSEAGAVVVGGHTIKNVEPIYGLSVTGTVHPKRILTNAAARPGDLLLLTKPLGTGIITTAIKRNLAPLALARRAIASMRQLNRPGALLAERRLVRAATDITGFGLLGHLASMCRASNVAAEINFAQVPTFGPQLVSLIAADCVPGGTRANLKAAESITDWPTLSDARKILLADAQTSGGLLLCVRPRDLAKVQAILKSHRTPAAAVIGHITRSASPRIMVRG